MAWNAGICLSQGKRHRPLKNRALHRIKRLIFDLYLNRFSRLNEFRICRVVERDHGGPAEALLPVADQTAVLQLPENAGGRLTAAVKLLLRLFHGEVKADGAVRFEKAIDLGNACPVQQQRVKHLCVVRERRKCILHQKTREWYVRRRQAVNGEFQKALLHTVLLSYPSICF